MSANTTTTAVQQFTKGEKVLLNIDILGTIENDVVYNNPEDPNSRHSLTMPKGTEVFIRKNRPRVLLDSSTGPGASAASVDYTVELGFSKQKYRLIVDAADIILDRVPHHCISQSRRGVPKEGATHAHNDYVYAIKEFQYFANGKKETVAVDTLIQISGRAFTGTGKLLPATTAYAKSATRNQVWRSNSYHPPGAFKKV
ncbi:hypothetical protein CPB84DRAFT_1792479 [Gymnopilus junonius]|uniref:Uncharacterized protein n=1 Tax=Gymnopilus junonius TaxID=109634 RepID=A0A9P5NDU9_GYMJU|nr:hypothetical protein CPB84DRAFT_1792479 [Gymnopilus junonius]